MVSFQHSNSFLNIHFLSPCILPFLFYGVAGGVSVVGTSPSWSSGIAPELSSLSKLWALLPVGGTLPPPTPCFLDSPANCLARFLALAARASHFAFSAVSLPACNLASCSFLASSAAFHFLSTSNTPLHHLSLSLQVSPGSGLSI